MNVEQRLNELLRRISYKPEFTVIVQPPLNIYLNQPSIRFTYNVMDSRGTGKVVPLTSIKTVDEYYLDNEDWFFGFIQQTIREMELHESDEWFRVDGKLYDDPHKRKI